VQTQKEIRGKKGKKRGITEINQKQARIETQKKEEGGKSGATYRKAGRCEPPVSGEREKKRSSKNGGRMSTRLVACGRGGEALVQKQTKKLGNRKTPNICGKALPEKGKVRQRGEKEPSAD